MTAQLTVDKINVAYGDFQVLWQADLRVDAGEIVAVLGPNGAGKSTLMNTISGLIKPRAGTITFEDRRIDGMPAHRTVGEGIAHVLERRRLFPFLTVLDNVLLGAHNPRAPASRRDARARRDAVSISARPARAARPHALGRRAADGRHRTRAHGAPEAADGR